MTKPKVDSIDIHIGNRLKLRRSSLGITQQELAKLLNISFQQVQKYEKGTNRISSKRLLEISSALKVSIDYFLKDILDYKERISPEKIYNGLAEAHPSYKPANDNSEIEILVKHFAIISQPEVRQQILNLIITLSKNEEKTAIKKK